MKKLNYYSKQLNQELSIEQVSSLSGLPVYSDKEILRGHGFYPVEIRDPYIGIFFDPPFSYEIVGDIAQKAGEKNKVPLKEAADRAQFFVEEETAKTVKDLIKTEPNLAIDCLLFGSFGFNFAGEGWHRLQRIKEKSNQLMESIQQAKSCNKIRSLLENELRLLPVPN
jgi:hypothetical protein